MATNKFKKNWKVPVKMIIVYSGFPQNFQKKNLGKKKQKSSENYQKSVKNKINL